MAQPYITWSDVRSVLASVDAFDLKINLNENAFEDATQDTLTDSGYIGRLFRDGIDLGAAEASAVAVTADAEWFYDSASDILYTYNTNASETYDWAAAPDTLANIQADFMNVGAEMAHAELIRHPRPFPKTDRSFTGADYEALIIKIVALEAAHEAIVRSDPGNPELLSIDNQLRNEDETGLFDLIAKGNLKFEFEKTASDEHGEIVPGTVDASSTGSPTETFGNASVDFAKLKATIGTGGTITYGTANTAVTYAITDGDGTAIVSDTVINITEIQTLGYGTSISWSDGIYKAGDFWYVYIRQHATTESVVGSFGLSRV